MENRVKGEGRDERVDMKMRGENLARCLIKEAFKKDSDQQNPKSLYPTKIGVDMLAEDKRKMYMTCNIKEQPSLYLFSV